MQTGSILHGDAAECAFGVKGGETVEADGAVGQTAVEIDGSVPYLRLTCVCMADSCHIEDTVALFHQAHTACQCSAVEVACVGGGADGGIIVVALHPSRHIDGEDIRRGTIGHIEGGVGVLVEKYGAWSCHQCEV